MLRGILDRLTPPVKRRSRRTVFVASVAAAVLVAAGVGIAGGIPNPFAGIGGANHPQTAQDVLDPAIVMRMVKNFNAGLARQTKHAGLPPESLLPKTARLIGQLPSGRRVYVLTTTSNWLCVLTASPSGNSSGGSIGCGKPLSQTEPTTISAENRVVNGPHATLPLSYGVARDGIVSVSFMGGGTEQTVRVQDNVWAYEGNNSALKSLTVHYANGNTQTINH